jgi:hypothetical protein
MKLKKKHEELRIHLSKLVDRYRWPDYVITDIDLKAFIKKESEGKGDVAQPLLWAKKCEEITIQQMWHEMAECWANNFGWHGIWRNNLTHAWASRNGSNITVRKILAQKRLIKKHKDFMGAMLACTAFSEEDKQRYISIWLANNS